MTCTQSYEPFRRLVLSREESAELSRPDFYKSAMVAAFLWGQILACMTIAWCALNLPASGQLPFLRWAIVFLCACLVGNRYYSLFILGHDGLHRRLHTNARINDLFTDLVIIGALGAVTHRNRVNHMVHHRSMGTPSDPDTYKYSPRDTLGVLKFLWSFTAVEFVLSAVKNVYRGNSAGSSQTIGTVKPQLPGPEAITKRDIFIILGWQLGLVTGLSAAFGWWGYFAMWLLPVYVFTFCADIARVYCEHSVEGESAALAAPWSERMVSHSSNFLERRLFAPMNMNCHTAHHLWPAIPWHNLPRATVLLHERSGQFAAASKCAEPIMRSSYFGYIVRQARCLGSQKKTTLNT